MAFDYNKAVGQANTLKGYAEAIEGYNKKIISIQDSLNDYWKSAMVSQIPELFEAVLSDLNNVNEELISLHDDIKEIANIIKDDEIRQQKEAEEARKRQQEAAAVAAQPVYTVQSTIVHTPTPTPPPAVQSHIPKTSPKKKNNSKDDDNPWEELGDAFSNFGKGLSKYFRNKF